MLEARDITFSYGKPHGKKGETSSGKAPAEAPAEAPERFLYRHFSLEVAPGERVALAAPSGFGKTTLCRLLAGYERSQEGEVLVDGTPLELFEGASPVQLIGQHPERALDPRMRMRDSLAEAGLRVSKGEAKSLVSDPLLAALGIRQRWLSRFPHELSGGELQRFCIARALATNPRYLVADEISTMLDALTQAQLWEFLLAEVEARGMGLVFVSHSPALTAHIATRTVNLADCSCRA